MIIWRPSTVRARTRAREARGADEGRLRVLVATPFYVPAWRGGGPIRSLAAMIEQHGDRHDFAVLTSTYDWGQTEPLELPEEAARGEWVKVGRARVRYVPVGGARALTSAGSRKTLTAAWRAATRPAPDVTYLNGVFPPVWTITPLLLRRLGLLRLGRVVIAPRGEFGPGALAIKWRKKQVFLGQARALGLFKGVAWHASSELEAAEIRALVPQAHIAVRENETQLPAAAWREESPDSASGSRSRPLRILYLGRLSEKKGVDVLLRAVRQVSVPVEVTIAGAAADEKYLARLERLGAEARHPVTFVGAVERERVDSMFRSHDVFAFPTAGENFGHTLAESLANGCPVLVTANATPWTDTVASGGGYAVPSLDPDTWTRVIDSFSSGGPAAWAHRRLLAADAYDAWRANRPTRSVFDLLDLHPR